MLPEEGDAGRRIFHERKRHCSLSQGPVEQRKLHYIVYSRVLSMLPYNQHSVHAPAAYRQRNKTENSPLPIKGGDDASFATAGSAIPMHGMQVEQPIYSPDDTMCPSMLLLV